LVALPMTELLQKAIAEVSKLSDEQQGADAYEKG
jgi:hypothetical protein